MNLAPGKHPAREVLQAFGLGKLDDASTTVVNRHLETCVDCKRQVAELSGDSLLNKLRQAKAPADTPAPHQTFTPVPKQAGASSAGIPPQLQNNPQYDILRELGSGGMGVVYLAKNKLMDRMEVLKVISTAVVNKPAALDRFLREIRAAALLSHDNVVKAYSALQLDELLVFAMEYVEGDDLAKVVKTQGPLLIANACYYVRQAALGLQHAHDKNMVHRDIKPHNLILARVGKKHMVKILDFGLAKASSEKKLDRDLTGEGAMLGTPDYMAPEQSLDAASADIRADIYSLGCTLYYLLTGAPPFDATSLTGLLLAHQTKDAKPLNLVRPEVPVELAAVVAKMMAKDPAKRYQKPAEVAQALLPFFMKAGAKTPATSPAADTGAKAPPRRPENVSRHSETMAARPSEIAELRARMPEKQANDPWDFASEPLIAKALPKRAKPKLAERIQSLRPKTLSLKPLLAAAVGLVLLAVLLGLLLRVKTKDGILVIKVNEPNPEVYVDGEKKVTITWNDGGTKSEIAAKPGTHKIEIKKDGFTMYSDEVTLEDGGRTIFTAKLEKSAVPGKTPPAANDGFVQLFNGKDLSGWETHPTYPGKWEVVDGPGGGILRCSDNKRSLLYSTRGDYQDFHLRIKARFSAGGDGSVFFRSSRALEQSGWPKAYEVQNHNLQNSGSLWTINGGWIRSERRPTPANEWYKLEVIAKGNRIIVRINEEETVNFTDDRRMYTSGHIALQHWVPDSVIEIQKVEIKEFKASSEGPTKTPETEKRIQDESKLPRKVFGKAIIRQGITGGGVQPATPNGSWRIDGDELVQDSLDGGWSLFPNIVFGDPDWSNYDLTLRAKWEKGTNGFAIRFHHTSQGDFSAFGIGSYANKGHELAFVSKGKWGRNQGMYKQGQINQDDWYDIRIEVREDHYRCFLAGILLFEGADERFKKGRIGLGSTENGGNATRFGDIKVTAPDGKLLWNGIPDLPGGPNQPTTGAKAPPKAPLTEANQNGFVPLFNGKDTRTYWVNDNQLRHFINKDGSWFECEHPNGKVIWAYGEVARTSEFIEFRRGELYVRLYKRFADLKWPGHDWSLPHAGSSPEKTLRAGRWQSP